MTFKERNRFCPKASSLIGTPQSKQLTFCVGTGDAAFAVGRDAPSTNHSLDSCFALNGIRVTHEHDKAATLAWQKAGWMLIENPHFARGQRSHFGKADQFKWIDAEIHSSGERNINISCGERGAGFGDGQQRRGARAIERITAAAKVEKIADASGNSVRQASGQRLLAHRCKGFFVPGLEHTE